METARQDNQLLKHYVYKLSYNGFTTKISNTVVGVLKLKYSFASGFVFYIWFTNCSSPVAKIISTKYNTSTIYM